MKPSPSAVARTALPRLSAVGAALTASAVLTLAPRAAEAQVAELVIRTPTSDLEAEDRAKAPDEKRREEARGAVMLQVAGIRGIATRAKGGPLSGDATSVVFAIDQENSSYTRLGESAGLSGRGSTHAHIGGGSGGFDGQYAGQITGGPRFGSDAHAIALRAGIGGHIRGNDRFYQSDLTLPVGELAYQIHVSRELFFEVGAMGGWVLVGRHNVDGVRRKLGNAGKVGGFALVTARHVQVVGSLSRVLTSSGPDVPVDTANLNACLSPFMGLLFCGNYSEGRSAVFLPGSGVQQDTRMRFLGASVGLGGISVD